MLGCGDGELALSYKFPWNAGCTYRIGRLQPSSTTINVVGCPTMAPSLLYVTTTLLGSVSSTALASGTCDAWNRYTPRLLIIWCPAGITPMLWFTISRASAAGNIDVGLRRVHRRERRRVAPRRLDVRIDRMVQDPHRVCRERFLSPRHHSVPYDQRDADEQPDDPDNHQQLNKGKPASCGTILTGMPDSCSAHGLGS